MSYYAFCCAVEKGDVATVKQLLPFVDPSREDNWSIRVASQDGYVEIVRLLLEDPRVNPADYLNWSIDWASRNGHTEVVRLLLEDPRVDPTAHDNLILKWARHSGHTEIVNILTEHLFRLDGAEYNKNMI
uniref:Uncharacterized protein n=1 Tax=viral metagenome TaxID=1070528 RepID=A0A6C0JWZ0_9ZZZZ